MPDTYFTGLLGSGHWKTQADGSYFIDWDPKGFRFLLEYLRTKELNTELMDPVEINRLVSTFDYFLVPYPKGKPRRVGPSVMQWWPEVDPLPFLNSPSHLVDLRCAQRRLKLMECD